MRRFLKITGISLLATFLFVLDVRADLIATGTVTQFHVATGNIAIFLSNATGCGTGWYYVIRSETDADTWKSLLALTMLSYAQGKTVSIYYTTPGCSPQLQFLAIDTVS